MRAYDVNEFLFERVYEWKIDTIYEDHSVKIEEIKRKRFRRLNVLL